MSAQTQPYEWYSQRRALLVLQGTEKPLPPIVKTTLDEQQAISLEKVLYRQEMADIRNLGRDINKILYEVREDLNNILRWIRDNDIL